MNKLLYIFILSLFLFVGANAQGVSRFDKKNNEVAAWVDDHFKKNGLPPFSFKYGGAHSGEFIKKWEFSVRNLGEIDKGVFQNLYRWKDQKTKLSVECDLKYYPDYNAVEWVLRFRNESTVNSLPIEQVKVIDLDFRDASKEGITLHYADGSAASRADFHPRKKVLSNGEIFELSPRDGRSSDHAFPFFNIESSSDQGVMLAIGWTGTWYSCFQRKNDRTVSCHAGMKNLNTYLEGNESIRTPSVCLLFWNDTNRMAGHNMFRRFMVHQQAPKVNGKPAAYPVSTSFNYGDPYPCNEYTCLTTDYALAMINRYKKFNLVPEVFWLDAGWYIKANEVQNHKNWANTVGNWVVDESRFPGGLKPIADAVHDAGAKFMLWFEPERVIKESKWGVELKKWMLDAKGTDAYLFNLGDKEALEWLCAFIGDFMEENGVDYYRQDFNMRVDNYWSENDSPGRVGISEIRHIEGLYAFWDYLLKRFPETIVDNCASGGRRLDFESMKRSAPLWRTDYNYGEPVGYQSHTYGLSFFLPLTGTGVAQSDRFTFRSSLGTSVIFNWKITDGASSFTEMQRCFSEFMDVRPYFYEDYYPLTFYDDMTADNIWLAYQLHRPSDDTGIIVAFRRDKNEDKDMNVNLSAIDPDKNYRITNRDTGNSFVKSGAELRRGLQLTLDEPRGSLLFIYGEEK